MTLENQQRSNDSASTSQLVVQAVGLATAMALSTAAPAAEHAVSVTETVQLASTSARTWAAINDFSAWPSWHPAFASTQVLKGDGHSQGSVRALMTQDGAKFTEELIAFDAPAHRYQYRIIDSPAPVADYVSTIEVKEARGGSSVVWSSSFKVKAGTSEADAKALISGVYRAGLDHLASVIK